MNSFSKAMVLGMSVLAFQSVSNAALLGLPGKQAPDIYSSGVVVQYNATSHLLTAFGGAVQFENVTGPVETINPASPYFQISLELTNSGVPTGSGGTLAIGGGITGLYSPGTLLTGSLVSNQFGFETGGGDQFEFLFTVTGGAMSVDIPQFAVGSQIVVKLDANFPTSNVGPVANFTGSFASDFDNLADSLYTNDDANADTYAVPEPASVALMGLASLMLFGRQRR